MENFIILMGIRKPEKEPSTPDEMRLEIMNASRDNALINQCMSSADLRGMSGEDRYVTLAYYALRQLQLMWEQNLDFAYRTPSPSILFVKDEP